MKKKFAGCKFLVFMLAAFLAWGVGATCFADDATQVAIQVSYPDGNEWAQFYNGAASAIDIIGADSEKANYVNVHITLLDANGDPATAGPAGEAIGGVVATVSTDLGSITGNENMFLADSADLTFDVTGVGPAARAHVKYACTSSCVPGTDTIDVAVGSLTAEVEVDVRAPVATSLVVRTPRTATAAPDLFDTIGGKQNNDDGAIFAGDSVYFEVLAREGVGREFTTAPELDGEEVTVTAYGNYNADDRVGVNEYEKEVIETATATFSGGVATGNMKIEKAGANSPGYTSKALQVVLTAELTDDDTIASGAPTVIPGTDDSVDTVDVRAGDPYKLIVGKAPLVNLIEEVETWFVIDDNSASPSTNDMAVFLADEYGNPTSAISAFVSVSLTGPLVDEPATLVDSSGPIPETAAQSAAWKIGSGRSNAGLDGIATLQKNGGDNQQELTGCNGSTCRGEPLEATFTVASTGLVSDSATVWLVRTATTGEEVTGDSYASGAVKIDLHLDTDKPHTLVVAGDMITLYITSASGSSGNPTTSEIVELKDNLVIKGTECSSRNALLISKSSQAFSSATNEGLALTAPAPDTTTKHIEIPIRIWGDCSQLNDVSLCFTMDDTSKGLEAIPLYMNKRGPAKCEPAAESSCKITLPADVVAADKDEDADPLVITSAFLLGDNTLLTTASVDTTDDYANVIDDAPSYGANVTNNVGVAITSNKATTITFAADDVGETSEVSISVPGVCSRAIQITNITDTVATGALRCTVEGPALSPPGGEAIIQVAASKAFSPTRSLLVSIDTDNSVTDAELRNLSGNIEGASSTQDLATGAMHRLVVSAPAAGTVTIVVGDTTPGEADLLDTGTCTATFAIDEEDPVATITPADGSPVLPTAEIAIAITDDVGVRLAGTSYTVTRDSADYSANCTSAGDGTASATITCAESGGGLLEGSYDVSVTPGDLAGNTGTAVTSAFTVSSVAACTTPTVTITPASATICQAGTQTFTAATACVSGSMTETYTWSAAGTAGSIDASGVYTAGSTAGTDTVTVTGDTTGESTTAAVTVTAGEVTISPATATVASGATQQFTASTSCSVTETYTYTISTNTSGGTIVAGLYTAGTTAGTDTVTATGDTTGDTDDATVTVGGGTGTITVDPSVVTRMNFIMWPSLMTITGTGTSFAFLSSAVTYSSAGILPMPALILGPTSILELIFVMPPWLAGGATAETVTATVTTGTEVATGTFDIEMWGLPIPSP